VAAQDIARGVQKRLGLRMHLVQHQQIFAVQHGEPRAHQIGGEVEAAARTHCRVGLMQRKAVAVAEHHFAAPLLGLPLNDLQVGLGALRRFQMVEVAGVLHDHGVDQQPLKVDAHVGIGLEIEREMRGELLHHPGGVEQRAHGMLDLGDHDLRAGRRPGRVRLGQREQAGIVGRSGQHKRAQAAAGLEGSPPLNAVAERERLEAPLALAAVQHAPRERRPVCATFPRPSEIAEMPVRLQRVDALSVVGHPDRIDPPQRVLDDVHLDVKGVCIKRVPDEFGQRLDR